MQSIALFGEVSAGVTTQITAIRAGSSEAAESLIQCMADVVEREAPITNKLEELEV
jgi:hypothetical protein